MIGRKYCVSAMLWLWSRSSYSSNQLAELLCPYRPTTEHRTEKRKTNPISVPLYLSSFLRLCRKLEMAGVGREGGVCAGGHSVHPKASADGCDTARAGGESLENSTYQCNYDCWDGSNLIFLSYFRWNSGISDLVTSFGAMRYFFKKQALPPALLHISHRYLNI